MPTAFRTDADGDWIAKDADAVLDYHMAWSDWLAGDTIASVVWTVPTGLVKNSQSINAGGPTTIDGVVHPSSTLATVWLSGGVAGETYLVACRVVTAGGRTDERSFRVAVASR